MKLTTKQGFEITGTPDEIYSLVDRFNCSTGCSEPITMSVADYKSRLEDSVIKELSDGKDHVRRFVFKSLLDGTQPSELNSFVDLSHAHGSAIRDLLVHVLGNVGDEIKGKIKTE